MKFTAFAGWAEVFVCGFAALTLWRIADRGCENRPRDIVWIHWLAWASLTWAVNGVVLLSDAGVMVRALISAVNSVILIAAVLRLDAVGRVGFIRLPEPILKVIRNLWLWMALGLCDLIGSLVLHSSPGNLPKLPDFLFSLFTIALLAPALFISFRERQDPLLAGLSVGVIAGEFVAQVGNYMRHPETTPPILILILGAKAGLCWLFVTLEHFHNNHK